MAYDGFHHINGDFNLFMDHSSIWIILLIFCWEGGWSLKIRLLFPLIVVVVFYFGLVTTIFLVPVRLTLFPTRILLKLEIPGSFCNRLKLYSAKRSRTYVSKLFCLAFPKVSLKFVSNISHEACNWYSTLGSAGIMLGIYIKAEGLYTTSSTTISKALVANFISKFGTIL